MIGNSLDFFLRTKMKKKFLGCSYKIDSRTPSTVKRVKCALYRRISGFPSEIVSVSSNFQVQEKTKSCRFHCRGNKCSVSNEIITAVTIVQNWNVGVFVHVVSIDIDDLQQMVLVFGTMNKYTHIMYKFYDGGKLRKKQDR